MKRKWKIAAAAVCVCFLMTVAYAATAGSSSDPLVTLSYLTDVFTPKVENLAKQAVTDQQTQNKSELDSAIDSWDNEVRQAIADAGVSGSGGSAFKSVTLSGGKTLVAGEGCEILLRSGSAGWTSDQGALMDTTGGSTLASGGSLSANHLYVTLAAGTVAASGSQNTGTVNVSTLNVRSGPGSSYSLVGTLGQNATVVIVSTSGGWYQITSGSLSGYVSADYVTLNPAGSSGAVTLMVRGSYQIR